MDLVACLGSNILDGLRAEIVRLVNLKILFENSHLAAPFTQRPAGLRFISICCWQSTCGWRSGEAHCSAHSDRKRCRGLLLHEEDEELVNC